MAISNEDFNKAVSFVGSNLFEATKKSIDELNISNEDAAQVVVAALLEGFICVVSGITTDKEHIMCLFSSALDSILDELSNNETI